MASAGLATIGHDAAAALLQLSPEQLTRLVSVGVVRRSAPGKYVPAQIIRDYIAHLHAEPDRVERHPTQAEIATHLDISDRRVRELATEWAIDSRELSLGEWRVRYLRKLREEAAGRAGGGDLDLVSERARLAKAQADRIEMQNAVTRKELAPTELIEDILAHAGARAARLLDTIPGELRRRCPQLTTEDLGAIATTIIKVRNIAATISLASLQEDEDTDDTAGTSSAADEAATERLLSDAMAGEGAA